MATEFWANHVPTKDINEILMEEFGEEDLDAFWETVEENLRDGHIRLIVATDELRPEIRRIIEYLNREMQNAEILGLELKCYGENDKSMILVPHIIGKGLEPPRPSEERKKWTVEKLRTAFSDLPDAELGRKLQKVLDWAVNKKCFMMTIATKPNFGLQGKSEFRLLSFYTKGDIYYRINEKYYPGGAPERDELVKDLKKLQLLDESLDPQQVVSGKAGRGLTKTLSDLSDEEIDAMLQVLGKYCI